MNTIMRAEDDMRCPNSNNEARKRGDFPFFHLLFYSGFNGSDDWKRQSIESS